MTQPPLCPLPPSSQADWVPRKARENDREGFFEVLTDPWVKAYLGGPCPP